MRDVVGAGGRHPATPAAAAGAAGGASGVRLDTATEDGPVVLIRADSVAVPLADDSVDLIVTSRDSMAHVGRRRLDPVQNWWSKVAVADPDACWLWTAGTDRDGYGKFAIGHGGQNQTHTRAHRFAYETFVGPIPDGHVVMHTCDTPPCVNPAHLMTGTPLDNNDDKVAKGRHSVPWGTPLARSQQNECKHGHPFTEANTYISSRGHRHCRACRREAARRAYWRKKGKEV